MPTVQGLVFGRLKTYRYAVYKELLHTPLVLLEPEVSAKEVGSGMEGVAGVRKLRAKRETPARLRGSSLRGRDRSARGLLADAHG